MDPQLSELEFSHIVRARLKEIGRENYQARKNDHSNRIQLGRNIVASIEVYQQLGLDSPTTLSLIIGILEATNSDFFTSKVFNRFWRDAFLSPSRKLATIHTKVVKE